MGARKLLYNTLYCIRSYKESSGGRNSYSTQFRQYDPRLGRWKSLDPLAGKFPSMSPFVAFNNNPIYFVDPLGLEGKEPRDGNDGNLEGAVNNMSLYIKVRINVKKKELSGLVKRRAWERNIW